MVKAKNLEIKESTFDTAIDNDLYISLVQNCNDGLILCEKKTYKVLEMNKKAGELLDLEELDRIKKISDIFDDEILEQVFSGQRIKAVVNDTPVKIHHTVAGNHIWFFVADHSDATRIESMSQKVLELNKELIGVFNEYGDDTLMVTDGSGVIEFAGEKISRTCGVSPEYLIGKNVYDMEKEGVFSPSVSVKVLETKKPQALIQKTRIGEELVSVSAPMFNRNGEIEKVISVTRDYSTQIKISQMIAELGDRVVPSNDNNDNQEDRIVTCNDKMFEIKTLIKMVADTKATVLINGETGTGKEVIARYIYGLSNRKDKPFVKVNCGTISHSIVESELFGYEEGSFTGASKGGKMGLIESANGGTLFLDEISELPIEQQVKLLHVLQEKMLIRVGGTKAIDLDIRVIAASNKDLEKQVEMGAFREDLYYRLNVIPIFLPALRERKGDIPLLAKYFFKRTCNTYNKEMQLSKNAISALEKYSWPGNIRQLENTIERLVLTTPKPSIMVEDLPDMILSEEDKIGSISVDGIMKLDEAVKLLEKKLIGMALDEYGTTVKAAEALGVNQSTVSRKMTQYGLKPNR